MNIFEKIEYIVSRLALVVCAITMLALVLNVTIVIHARRTVAETICPLLSTISRHGTMIIWLTFIIRMVALMGRLIFRG